jgi:hypothetical protein
LEAVAIICEILRAHLGHWVDVDDMLLLPNSKRVDASFPAGAFSLGYDGIAGATDVDFSCINHPHTLYNYFL